MAITMSMLVNHLQISDYLNNYIMKLYNKFYGQLRFSLSKLNGITTVDINRLFKLANINPDWFMDIYNEYPEGANTPRQPINNLLTLIVLKAYLTKDTQLAVDTNTLFGLVVLGRLMRKWFIHGVDEKTFDKCMDTLSKKGLFGSKGVIFTVNKLTSDLYNKWIPQMAVDPNAVYPRYRYIVDMRNRFNQVMKTCASHYYYVWSHRNDVDLNVKINERTKEIMEWIQSNALPMNIVQYAASIANCSVDIINNLHHNIQLYNSMQSQMYVIINKILDGLYHYMIQYKDQNGYNININDDAFIRRFINTYKRSTIMLRMVGDEVFSASGYERFQVLAYAYILTIYVDSSNHYGDYIDNNSDVKNNGASEYGNDDDSYDYDDYYNESIEALYDGIILDDDTYLKRNKI